MPKKIYILTACSYSDCPRYTAHVLTDYNWVQPMMKKTFEADSTVYCVAVECWELDNDGKTYEWRFLDEYKEGEV